MTGSTAAPVSDAAETTGDGTTSGGPMRPRRARPPRRGRTVLLVVALILVALAIAAGAFALTHSNSSPKPAPSPSASAQPSPAPSAPPSDAPLSVFDASAPLQKNVDLFNRTAARVAASGNPVGADFTNALAAVGFDKSQMQITADRTTINAVAPAIVFAVKVHGECLLGQYTPDSHEYDHQVVAPISTGSCLIGEVSAPK